MRAPYIESVWNRGNLFSGLFEHPPHCITPGATMPRVSVLTPIYKTNPKHLRECIESVLKQTFTDFEFLILNDSPDEKYLADIVKSYHDPRIKYIENKTNMGISPSRNRLLKMARGEYIAIFDHDDISMPTRLAQQVAYMDANPNVGVLSGWLQYFGEADTIAQAPENDTDIKICLTDDCYVAHTAAMVRKSVLVENHIEYEELYTPAEDYRLWARLMDITRFHNLQTVLVKYRFLDTNTSNVQSKKMTRAHDAVSMELRNKYPAYYKEFLKRYSRQTQFRLRLFGFIPLIKIKQGWVQLFECIPILKTKWK